jgi:hypothetical protein
MSTRSNGTALTVAPRLPIATAHVAGGEQLEGGSIGPFRVGSRWVSAAVLPVMLPVTLPVMPPVAEPTACLC